MDFHKHVFIKKKGLGGAMFWEYNQDNGQLLGQIWNDLKKEVILLFTYVILQHSVYYLRKY